VRELSEKISASVFSESLAGKEKRAGWRIRPCPQGGSIGAEPRRLAAKAASEHRNQRSLARKPDLERSNFGALPARPLSSDRKKRPCRQGISGAIQLRRLAGKPFLF